MLIKTAKFCPFCVTIPQEEKKQTHEVAPFEKKCIFAALINRGRVPQNLITRLCQ